MKVSTLNEDGTWTHEEFELPPEVQAEMDAHLAEIKEMEADGRLAGWCKCEDGSPAHDRATYFDYREGSSEFTDGNEPDNLGASHGWYDPRCGKLIQAG